jgi:hypothetical protein
MYFNPTLNTTTTGDATFLNTSGITFTGSPNAVNCMAFLNNNRGTAIDTTKLVIAGNFTINTTYINIAIFNVSTAPQWSLNTDTITSIPTAITSTSTTINSIIVVGTTIYVAGTNNGNCLFYSYKISTSTWTNLLGTTTYPGTINVLKRAQSFIAIGGDFTSLGNAANCNNIVLYTIGSTGGIGFTALGGGVAGDPNTNPAIQVFALEYLSSNNQLWVGGYFTKVNNNVIANSIAIYDINTTTWSVIDRNGDTAVPTTKGLTDSSGGADPGVVYAINIAASDNSVIVVGGSFKTKTTETISTPQDIFNLVKITTAITPQGKRNYTKYNSKSQ